MAVVQLYGKPDLFITFTCNPKWHEIRDNLNGSTPQGRPDLIARVFNLKLRALIEDIYKHNIFGRATCYIYTVEFQKRGLPHAHILLTLSDNSKIRNADDVEHII